MLLDGRLKLRHLVLAIAVADHGSVVRAAKELHVTQPVVTRGLRDLEQILTVELFHRLPRGMEPTVFGEAFLGHARAVIAHIRQAEQHIAELADASRGTVTVGTHLAGSNLLLPHAIAALKQSKPNVTVVVREGTPDLLVTALLAGDLDLIVGRLTSGQPAPGLHHLTLYAEPIRLVTRLGHPLCALANPVLNDLAGYPWILPVQQTALRHELEELLQRNGFELPSNRVECTSMLTMRTLIVETDVIAALPLLIADADPELAVLPIPLEGITRTVGVTLPSQRQPNPSAAALLTQLATAASEIRTQLRLPQTTH